jgi:hypothetical protein
MTPTEKATETSRPWWADRAERTGITVWTPEKGWHDTPADTDDADEPLGYSAWDGQQ